jgi:hypothetical protein
MCVLCKPIKNARSDAEPPISEPGDRRNEKPVIIRISETGIRIPPCAWQSKKEWPRLKFRIVTASGREQAAIDLALEIRRMILADRTPYKPERDVGTIQRFKQAGEKQDVRE